MIRLLSYAFAGLWLTVSLLGQQAAPSTTENRTAAVTTINPGSGAVAPPPVAVAPAPTSVAPTTKPNPTDTGFAPTWETQKHARTYVLGIPAPRGQIVDRNGEPLAQTRVSYNLGITFPTPPTFNEREVFAFAQREIGRAQGLIGRPLSFKTEELLKHYKNRAVLPFIIAQDLRVGEVESFRRAKADNLVLQPVYQRHYPNGQLAGHLIGYAGRGGRMQDGPIENNELLWPNAEGRDGLEASFDNQLQGKVGQFNISFDAQGKRASEQITIPPQPGYNVVTALDLNVQRICEEALSKSCKRGAMVMVDPNTGDVLAMASWPCYNPNSFVPLITASEYKALQDDPNIPLLPRAFRATYPPGSTFKVFVGIAALQTGRINKEDEFNCPPALEIGGLTFRNWKKADGGSMNFAMALTQSCDTWFYQVGMKIGPRLILDYAQQFGFGQRTGLPLAAESSGLMPSDDYMLKTHKRRIMNGDVANLSIGQGDATVTPLQMAMAMAAVGNGGTLYAARLVQQVQSIDNQIVTAYDVRARALIDMDKEINKEVHKAMAAVVSSPAGTAGRASIPNVSVAGKTGTAQWGPKTAERTAAWFAGFAPSDKPRYAFSVVYESDEHNADETHGGTSAAPIVGKVLRQLFKEESVEKKSRKKKGQPIEERAEDGTPVRRAEPVKPDDAQ
ncbi:MAG TPA: penicillin-binding protein 2 [Chthoniobacteraceae bacterium]|jgi:penicillin-binding protein 2|nr:penicillin-binding protein 2 [Chthoniobacteraceae bacterium]